MGYAGSGRRTGYPQPNAAFLPSALPDLVAWYRFGVGIRTSDGTNVTQWEDQSGNGRHLKQGTDTNRPAKQSDGSILFDGADNYLKTDAFTFAQPCTYYILGKQVTWTDIDKWCDGDAVNSGYVQQRTTTPGIRIGTTTAATAINSDLAVNTYGVICAVLNGASSRIQINNGTAVTGGVGSSTPGGFTLGAGGTAVASYSNIQVKEVALFNTEHAARKRETVIKYLAQVGGLSL